MNILINKIQKPFSDYLGIISSLFCLIHCLLTPVILSFQMMYFRNAASFEVFEYIFLSMSFVAVYFSSRNYKNVLGKGIMWITFSVFALSVLVHDFLPAYISYVASILLIFLHFLNIYINKGFRINSNKSIPSYR